MSFLSILLKSLLDFLFPQSAAIKKLETLPPEKLLALLPPSNLERDSDVLALFSYHDPLVKEIVWEVKYKGNRGLAAKLGTILYDVIASELMERNVFEKFGNALLIPMPVSNSRRLERGWNQAELLAQAVKAQDLGGSFQYLPRVLAKVRHTESQTHTHAKKERLENLHHSMKVLDPAAVSGHFIVLLDDVTTTGATFSEARRALKEGGARKILCVALAH